VIVHREFSYESPDERILKIGPHLPKLLSNIKGLTFLEHGVVQYVERIASSASGLPLRINFRSVLFSSPWSSMLVVINKIH